MLKNSITVRFAHSQLTISGLILIMLLICQEYNMRKRKLVEKDTYSKGLNKAMMDNNFTVSF